MNPIQLLLALHCHQPVGTPDAAVAQAYDRAYRPFLDLVARHPHVRLALHLSGPLLDWLERERPTYLDDVRTLAERGQVELLGGGLEEPILAALPERDAWGQVGAMQARVAELFGATPHGVWLPERIWEPDLPRLLQPAGIRFTYVDAAAVLQGGAHGPLRGYYATEKAGVPLALFPIDAGLAERLPWAPAREVVGYLKAAAEAEAGPGGRGITLACDGETFGLWPRTHAWLYERSGLDELFRALADEAGSIELLPPSEYLARFGPQGRAYPPSGGNPELLGDGAWGAMLARYPEAGTLHARMLHTSRKLADAETEVGGETETLAEARRALYRAQGHDAAWPSRSGGIQLPALRHAAYAALIQADNLIDVETRGEGDFIEYEEDDLDGDLRDEALLANAQVAAFVDPDEGGAVLELDYRPGAFNLTHLMGRRSEPFHAELRELEAKGPGVPPPDDAPPSPHEPRLLREPGLAEKIVDDGSLRHCFIDRFHRPGFGLESLQRASDGDVGNFAGQPYVVEASGVDEEGDLSASITLVREGQLQLEGGPRKLLVEKTFHVPIDAARLEAEYILENPGDAPLAFTFAPELNLTFLVGDAPDRYLELSNARRATMATRANHGTMAGLGVIDEAQGVGIELTLDREAEIWAYPVETVGRTAAGFERLYQGTCLLLRMPLSLPPGESARIVIALELARVEVRADEPEPAPPPEPAAEAAPAPAPDEAPTSEPTPAAPPETAASTEAGGPSPAGPGTDAGTVEES